MPFLRRVWYWVIILWLAELIYLKSNLMLYEENSKDSGDPWKTKKGNYQTDIFSNESVEQSLIRNCKSICTKLPKILSEEEEMAKLSIEGMILIYADKHVICTNIICVLQTAAVSWLPVFSPKYPNTLLFWEG